MSYGSTRLAVQAAGFTAPHGHRPSPPPIAPLPCTAAVVSRGANTTYAPHREGCAALGLPPGCLGAGTAAVHRRARPHLDSPRERRQRSPPPSVLPLQRWAGGPPLLKRVVVGCRRPCSRCCRLAHIWLRPCSTAWQPSGRCQRRPRCCRGCEGKRLGEQGMGRAGGLQQARQQAGQSLLEPLLLCWLDWGERQLLRRTPPPCACCPPTGHFPCQGGPCASRHQLSWGESSVGVCCRPPCQQPAPEPRRAVSRTLCSLLRQQQAQPPGGRVLPCRMITPTAGCMP